MASPIIPLALTAGAAWFVLKSQKKSAGMSTVRGKSGKVWLVKTLGVSGTGPERKTTVEVYAPRASYGPHEQVLVARYVQTGDDKTARVVQATGAHALPAMITDAGKDFGIKKA